MIYSTRFYINDFSINKDKREQEAKRTLLGYISDPERSASLLFCVLRDYGGLSTVE